MKLFLVSSILAVPIIIIIIFIIIVGLPFMASDFVTWKWPEVFWAL